MIEQENQDARYQELEMRIPLTFHITDGEDILTVEGKFHVPVYWGDGKWMDKLHEMFDVFKQVITLSTKQSKQKSIDKDEVLRLVQEGKITLSTPSKQPPAPKITLSKEEVKCEDE